MVYIYICTYILEAFPNIILSSSNLFTFCAAGEISVVQSLLEELPGQFLGYMRSRDLKPLLLERDKMKTGSAYKN